MNIHIIAVGKIRENYLQNGINEFVKRTQPYSPLKITEIEPEPLKKNLESKSIVLEGQKILSIIPAQAYVVAMEVKGKALSSEQFAQKIKEINLSGCNQMIFIIGGALGLSDDVRKRADIQISMSAMTFPHQIIRLFLMEQIYRAFRIINGEPYHK